MKSRRTEVGLFALLAVAVVAAVVGLGVVLGGGGATVILETNPERASAYVDGNFIGTTPLTREHFPTGTHVLRVTKFGHVPLLCEIEIQAGKNLLKYDLVELPGGTLEIKSTPPGAEVFIDGESCGWTPLTVKELTTGGHPVRLSLVNYIDWMETVNIEEDKTAKLDVALTTRTAAHLIAAIKANPKAAVYRVDLGHYYILRSEWKQAEDAFAEALVLTANESQNAYYQRRLRQEIQNIFSRQFEYESGPEGQKAVARAFLRALKSVPRHLDYYGYAVYYAAELGMTDEAQQALETGILTFPYDENWTLSALQRVRDRGNPDQLLNTLERRIRKDPDDFVSRFQRMTLLRQRGRTDEVIEEYEHLARLARSQEVKAKLLGKLGREWERKDEYAKAAQAYQRAVAAETSKKEKASMQYNLVRALERQKRNGEALAAWEEAVRLQENVELACRWRLDWAQLCIGVGHKDKAHSILNDVLKLSKDDNTRTRAQELLQKMKADGDET